MQRQIRMLGYVILVLAVAGCAGISPAESDAPNDVLTTPSPSPSADGFMVSCGDGPVFPAIHLKQAGRADRGEDAAAVALRSYLAREGGPFGAPSWIRVAQSSDYVQFLGRRADGSFVYVRFQKRAGEWHHDVGDYCSVTVPLEPGTSLIDWWLDPAIKSEATGLELRVLLHRVPCDPGDARLEYVLPPFVLENESSVTATIVGQERSVEYCAGPIPMVIELAAPLGGRAVFDGGVYPARRVTNEPP